MKTKLRIVTRPHPMEDWGVSEPVTWERRCSFPQPQCRHQPTALAGHVSRPCHRYDSERLEVIWKHGKTWSYYLVRWHTSIWIWANSLSKKIENSCNVILKWFLQLQYSGIGCLRPLWATLFTPSVSKFQPETSRTCTQPPQNGSPTISLWTTWEKVSKQKISILTLVYRR